MIALLLSLSAAQTLVASPATACRRFVAPPTEAGRAAEAARITRLSGTHTTSTNIQLTMIDADWRLVWATPDDSEEGVFFLKRAGRGYRLIDTWGGVSPSGTEQAGDIGWATKQGVPLRLARCFATIELNDGIMR